MTMTVLSGFIGTRVADPPWRAARQNGSASPVGGSYRRVVAGVVAGVDRDGVGGGAVTFTR
jgi:hypothetical protein